jgi:hypothetical protein
MNELLREMLEAVLEIQQGHYARERDAHQNAKEVVRITKAAVDERELKIAALEEALNEVP